jgi:hypothetical protein
VDFALWLSAFPPLLQKHEKEILLNPLGWRDYVRRKVNLLQPRQRLGRPPEQNVTRAAELKAQGKSWPAVFAEMRIDGWDARYHLREAVRARHRRRRYKL